jgi:hypothetical protein
MNSFLFNTAQDIITNHEHEFHSWCFIFPNKRTNYYFRKSLAQVSGKIRKAPKMIDISSFIKHLTGLNEADELSLLFDLYLVFIQHTDNELMSFDNFYKLGEIVLSDFNEIDAWLADPVQIYKNIENLNDIDETFDWLSEEQKNIIRQFWLNFSPETKSEEKELFLNIRNKLPAVYSSFKQKLFEQNNAYRGLMYRRLSEMINDLRIKDGEYVKYVFIGFNALNNAELQLFKYFQKNKKALFYWNTDAYYLNDPDNEAGFFLRKNFKELNISLENKDSKFTEPKDIRIIGVPQNIGQAKIVSDLLSRMGNDIAYSETALVLADENNLFPILNALPESIESINVTMGVPLKHTPIRQLIRLISELYLSNSCNEKSIYYKPVIKLLKHPYVIDFDNSTVQLIIDEIHRNKYTYIPYSLLKNQNLLLTRVFKSFPDPLKSTEFLDLLLNILFLVFDKNEDRSESVKSLKNEYIYVAYKKIKKLKELLENHNVQIGLKLTVHYLNHILNNQSIPFEGSIDKGLQIIGIMETRNIAFKNLIITGFNEGIFPKANQKPSFISQSLRHAFGLPVFQHQDAVFAYIFYSLIQQADSITILYNNLSGERNPGEMSRFLLQLIHESDFNINIGTITEKIKIPESKQIVIQKTGEIIEMLSKFIVPNQGHSIKKISPAALNTYLDCSLKFYFSYICEIKEYDFEEDEFSPALTGNMVHEMMHILYREYLNKKVVPDDIQRLKLLAEPTADRVIRNRFKLKVNDNLSGNQVLLKTVLMRYCEVLLKNDIKYAPFKILYLEAKDFSSQIPIQFNNQKQSLTLNGIIDRIDKKENTIRIVDYKTGKESSKVDTISDLFSKGSENRAKNVFQILFYTYLFKQHESNDSLHVQPSLYYLRSMHDQAYDDKIKIKGSEKESVAINPQILNEILPEFETGLQTVLTEIFSPDSVFEQTVNTKICKYCIYAKICNRME